LATSTKQALVDGEFQTVIDEIDEIDPKKVTRLIMCSGKVYYDIIDAREAADITDAVVLRIEQLYPFPARTLIQELSRYPNATDTVWCQEEPKNMGGWSFMEPNLEWVLEHVGGHVKRARYAGRPASAATATGLARKHAEEQKKLVADALG
jgi:2-oxoglutarate dehydrogenase E1 component